jgi:hypothetical protein
MANGTRASSARENGDTLRPRRAEITRTIARCRSKWSRYLATPRSFADAGSAPNGRRAGLLPAAAAALHTVLGQVPAYSSAAAFSFAV